MSEGNVVRSKVVTRSSLAIVFSPNWTVSLASFEQAATWFVDAATAAAGRWDEPALGQWTVRDLVGHTSRALLTVETYLDQPVASVTVSASVDYFRLALAAAGDPAAVARRGVDTGRALGADPAAQVAQIAERVLSRVHATGPQSLAATPVGEMTLANYLPTRTFELTVHTCDRPTRWEARPRFPAGRH